MSNYRKCMGKSRFSRNWSKVFFQITTVFFNYKLPQSSYKFSVTGITHYDIIIRNYDIIITHYDIIITNYDRTHRINVHYASIDKVLSELELRAVRVQRVWAQQHYSMKLLWLHIFLYQFSFHLQVITFLSLYHRILFTATSSKESNELGCISLRWYMN